MDNDSNKKTFGNNQVEERISQLNKIDQDIISLLNSSNQDNNSIENLKDIIENIKEEIKLLQTK